MNMKEAVIYRLYDVIKQKDITVNEAAIRSGVPPSTLKNILYGVSNNAGIITIPEFFGDSIFLNLDPELK